MKRKRGETGSRIWFFGQIFLIIQLLSNSLHTRYADPIVVKQHHFIISHHKIVIAYRNKRIVYFLTCTGKMTSCVDESGICECFHISNKHTNDLWHLPKFDLLFNLLEIWILSCNDDLIVIAKIRWIRSPQTIQINWMTLLYFALTPEFGIRIFSC